MKEDRAYNIALFILKAVEAGELVEKSQATNENARLKSALVRIYDYAVADNSVGEGLIKDIALSTLSPKAEKEE